MEQNNDTFVVGILNPKQNHFHPHIPSLYTKITNYFPWILERTGLDNIINDLEKSN